MPTPDERLLRRWGHSFEEDHEGVLVYRPADHEFPRARGRAAIEFRPDGSYVDWVVGPGDARQPRAGSWQVGDDGQLRVTTATGGQRIVDVVSVSSDRLEIRPRSAS